MGMHWAGGMSTEMTCVGPWMLGWGLVRLIVVVVFLWLFYRTVVALEKIARSKKDQSG